MLVRLGLSTLKADLAAARMRQALAGDRWEKAIDQGGYCGGVPVPDLVDEVDDCRDEVARLEAEIKRLEEEVGREEDIVVVG